MASRSEASFASSIPQPSRYGSPKKDKLCELPASSVNSRNHAMAPPTAKGVPRKTLAERAGEPPSKPGAPPAARPGATHVNATSLSGMQRQWSQSTSASSRPYSSASSRAVSNSSYGSSLGPGSRPPSVSSTRSRADTGSMRAKRSGPGRPPSVLESHMEGPPDGQVLGKRKAFDMEERLQAFEEEFHKEARKWNEGMKANAKEQQGLAEMSELYKSRVTELEMSQENLNSKNRLLQAELDSARVRVTSVLDEQDRQKRTLHDELEDSTRRHRREIDELQHTSESDRRKLLRDHADEIDSITKDFESQLEESRNRHASEIEAINNAGAHSQKEIETELEQQLAALKSIEDDLERTRSDIVREKDLNDSLREQLATAARREADLDRSVQRLEGHIQFLESDNKSQSHAFADLESRMQRAIRESDEAKEKLIKEETLRRKLHNQVQELKGNIRVFCRVRPTLKADEGTATIDYPDQEIDAKEVEVMGPEEKSSLGNITTKKHAFNFDKVFGPAAQNQHVFDEISQLVQSALDGYNVCIFCYGQTGSGKTFTMSSADGMIPLAVNQIYSTAKALEEKGWKYTMSGSFIEVYNENLNDLLGKADDFDKKKHEIRHDMQRNKTEVTGIKTVELDCPGRVDDILRNANKNRTVAATQANERSSRSHSVFILKLNGENSVTGERSEGTLNLVDLAGSERLSHSGATGDRLKETQNINKSLSCLGDVIGALGQGKEGSHIPYRNSKLTYLLQFSLGGNSKTLMFVMISPLQAHLSETLTSLKFATKVHNTHIGTARKQTKTKD